jgi:Xaa-Pro aminopeptidase
MSHWPEGLNRTARAISALPELGVDALLALTPENAFHLSGVTNFIATRWRTPGLAASLVSANGDRAVVTGDNGISVGSGQRHFTYPLWIDNVDLRDCPGDSCQARISTVRGDDSFHRPAQYEIAQIAACVAAAIRQTAPEARKIGTELSLIPAPFMEMLSRQLPNITWVDATAVFDDFRAIKGADELDLLRDAGKLTEQGLTAAIANLEPGMKSIDAWIAYQQGVLAAMKNHPLKGLVGDIEGLVAVGAPGAGDIIGPGVTIKFDMQVELGGYHSDLGRTVALDPTAEQRAIYDALSESLMHAIEAVKIGAPLSSIYAAGAKSMRSLGFPSYSRGHLGHSLGLTTNFEEAPFICPDEHRPIVPGMALSLELPFYVGGVGTFQLETMLLIHDSGVEQVDRLPFALDLDRALGALVP